MKDYKIVSKNNMVDYASGKDRESAIKRWCFYTGNVPSSVKSCKEIDVMGRTKDSYKRK